MTKREELHAIVDKLTDADIEKLSLYIEAVTTGDPVLYSLATAPWDDEPETSEERALVEEGVRDVRKGRLVGAKEIEDEFG